MAEMEIADDRDEQLAALGGPLAREPKQDLLFTLR